MRTHEMQIYSRQRQLHHACPIWRVGLVVNLWIFVPLDPVRGPAWHLWYPNLTLNDRPLKMQRSLFCSRSMSLHTASCLAFRPTEISSSGGCRNAGIEMHRRSLRPRDFFCQGAFLLLIACTQFWHFEHIYPVLFSATHLSSFFVF